MVPSAVRFQLVPLVSVSAVSSEVVRDNCSLVSSLLVWVWAGFLSSVGLSFLASVLGPKPGTGGTLGSDPGSGLIRVHGFKVGCR